MDLTEVFVPAIVFIAIAYILKAWMDHREKMRLIQKGGDMPNYEVTKPFFSGLKLAGVLIGFGVGMLIGNLLSIFTLIPEQIAYFSMILLFGGLSIIIFHLLEKKGKI